MASINYPTNEKVFRIPKWLGVNECPESESDLRLGEASSMRNFCITDYGALRLRPGTKTVAELPPIKGLWTGYVGENYVMVAAANGKAYKVDPENEYSTTEIGDINTDNHVHMFGFDSKLYFLNGVEYKVWDGNTLSDVEGYIPIIATATVPSGGGIGLEQANKLTPKKRQIFSPDSNASIFQLAEREMDSSCEIVEVKHNGKALTPYTSGTRTLNQYVADLNAGTIEIKSKSIVKQTDAVTIGTLQSYYIVTDIPSNAHITQVKYEKHSGGVYLVESYVFDRDTGAVRINTMELDSGTYYFSVYYYEVLSEGINTLEITWKGKDVDRSTVLGMMYSELYNGKNDNRVFLYGNDTNMAIYSGLDEYGKARADYFPDLNVVHFGNSNTALTSMIRHYDRLLAFKEDSTYSTYYDTVTLPDGTVTAGFYVTPVNRNLGNAPLGQVCLVENRPRSLNGRDMYEWKATSTSGNITGDQRNASAISDRISNTLDMMDLEKAIMFNDTYHREFYMVQNGLAIVNNYDNDTWYVYDHFPAAHMVLYKNDLCYATDSGEIRIVSYDYRDDNGVDFKATWESGAMSFGSEHLNKYSSMVWLGLKPEEESELMASIETNKEQAYSDRIIVPPDAPTPAIIRLRLHSRKFEYYKLKFEAGGDGKTITLLSANIRVRFAGNSR